MQFHPIDFRLSSCHWTDIMHNHFFPFLPHSLLCICPECVQGSAIIYTMVSGPACWMPINYLKSWGHHWRSSACRSRLCMCRERKRPTDRERQIGVGLGVEMRARLLWMSFVSAGGWRRGQCCCFWSLALNYSLSCLMRSRDEHSGLTHAPLLSSSFSLFLPTT